MAGEQQDAISIVRKIGTEFADVKDEELKQWQEICAPAISAAKFGKEYNLALALLICHSMKLAGLGNTSLGSIADTARFARLLRRSEYRLTSYGLQFLTVRSRHCISINIRR